MRPESEGGADVWQQLEGYEMRRRARGAGPGGGIAPAPACRRGRNLLPQIKHIVVLMMENHSYDNYLGMLKGRGEGFPLGPDNEPDGPTAGTDGTVIRAFHLPSTVQRRRGCRRRAGTPLTCSGARADATAS